MITKRITLLYRRKKEFSKLEVQDNEWVVYFYILFFKTKVEMSF